MICKLSFYERKIFLGTDMWLKKAVRARAVCDEAAEVHKGQTRQTSGDFGILRTLS